MTKYKKYISRIKLIEEPTTFTKKKISQSQDAVKFARPFFKDHITLYESMFSLILDRAGNTINFVKISQGGTAGTVIDTKIICRAAISDLASSIILFHNHPSGNKNPSESDKKATYKVKEAVSFIDVTLHDHIIITKDDYFSFADNGLI